MVCTRPKGLFRPCHLECAQVKFHGDKKSEFETEIITKADPLIIEGKPKPIMKIIVSIKLLLFVMSAHSFKSIFYFLIIRSAFENQSTEMWMNTTFFACYMLMLRHCCIRALLCLDERNVSQSHTRLSQQAYRWHIRPQPDFSDNFWYFIVGISHAGFLLWLLYLFITACSRLIFNRFLCCYAFSLLCFSTVWKNTYIDVSSCSYHSVCEL